MIDNLCVLKENSDTQKEQMGFSGPHKIILERTIGKMSFPFLSLSPFSPPGERNREARSEVRGNLFIDHGRMNLDLQRL